MSNNYYCVSCGKKVSKPGGYCKPCGFYAGNFKEKTCDLCKESFTPKSGAAKYCEKCRSSCLSCGKELPKTLKGKKPRQCHDCSIKNRVFSSKCIKCGSKFVSTNGRTKLCSKCATRTGFCFDCGVSVSKKAIRCNPCSARLRSSLGNNLSTPRWRKYMFDGIMYRSSWEVRIAKICKEINLKFVYELFDKESKTFPDFYFPDFDLYLEIHPDCFGEKKIPMNLIHKYILLKTLGEVIAFSDFLVYKVLGIDEYAKRIQKLPTNSLKYRYKNMVGVAARINTSLLMRDHS